MEWRVPAEERPTEERPFFGAMVVGWLRATFCRGPSGVSMEDYGGLWQNGGFWQKYGKHMPNHGYVS